MTPYYAFWDPFASLKRARMICANMKSAVIGAGEEPG